MPRLYEPRNEDTQVRERTRLTEARLQTIPRVV